MKYLSSRLLLFGLALTLLGCDTGSGADEPELPEGTLLFVARDTTAADSWRSHRVYKADIRTGRMVALTSPDDPGTDRGPAFEAIWSPDGRRIVYHETIGYDAGHLTIMNADGSGKRTLSDPWEHRALPMWGPDARTVFYEQRVYLGASVGLFALDVETAPASDPVCVMCIPEVAFGAERFAVDGDTLSTVAVAPGSESGLVVLASPLSPPLPMIGDYDVHLYEADYRTRKVLRRLTEQPIRGHRFVVAPGGTAILFARYQTRPDAPQPSVALFVVPQLGQAASLVAGTLTPTRAFLNYRWASDGQHVVLQRGILNEQGYATGDYLVDVFDAQDPAPVLIPLRWVPPKLEAVRDLFIP